MPDTIVNWCQRGGRRVLLASLSGIAGWLLVLPAGATATAPTPGAYQEGDYLGFRNILPPGENGLATADQISQFVFGDHSRPPHNNDQLDPYANLVYSSPGLTEPQVDSFFKDASFGVAPGHVESQYTPNCAVTTAPSPDSSHCGDVTIVRDDYGVPHIYGADRAAAMFGSGYVAAQDRLFFMDVERHLGRGELASFLGGSNASTDRAIFKSSPYTEADLQQQYDQLDNNLGTEGAQAQADIQNYVDGINQYIAEARQDPADLMPGEYAIALGDNNGPDPWKVTDVVATAALVAGQFGTGGGNELGSAQVLQAAQDRFGASDGTAVWSDFREAEDPETPTTVQGQSFPYEVPPANPQGVAIPDPGSLQDQPVTSAATRQAIDPAHAPTMRGLTSQDGASNALLVSASESSSGHPIAVMGPQVGYFSPEILMEQDIHAPAGPAGPALDARGVGFAGVSLYILLGRGPDYAWSATSAGQDITDTYALHLCDPNNPSAQPTISDDGYRFNGDCLPFEHVTQTESWTPNAADPTPAGSQTMTALRTKLGIVTKRGTINGDPVAFTSLRSTYFHDLDSALGFAELNDPAMVDSPQTFQDAVSKIGFTFNWFYADNQHIAYFNSGANPVRPAVVDPNFPVDAPASNTLQYAWQNYDPATHTEDQTPASAHPQAIDQSYLSSWNNKQAPGYRAADDEWSDQSVDRVDSLNQRIQAGIAGASTMTRAQLVDAMESAGTVDLRGAEVLPWALKVLRSGNGPPADAKLRQAMHLLHDWRVSGAHRLDANGDGTYAHSEAIRIMDAWWPRLVQAEFRPALGSTLYQQIQSMIGLDDAAGPHGSAYNQGWYGYVQKDLRTILGAPVTGAYSRVYCGGGNLGDCRQALTASLEKALKHDSNADLYPGGTCVNNQGVTADAQWCHDAIRPTTVGAITQPPFHWINRPTFQQVVEVQGHR